MDEIPRASEILYTGLCHVIGTPTEVTIRRDVWDMRDKYMKSVQYFGRDIIRMMLSGSHREGFRFKSSDADLMYWHCHHKLITEISQARLYDRTENDIILMEDNDTPPGFVKLRFLAWPKNICVARSAVQINDKVYLSSALHTDEAIRLMTETVNVPGVTLHGPCANVVVKGVEWDHAFCIAGVHWPELIRPWIEKCILLTWPPAPVVEEILKNGYHCVPVGSKIVSNGNLLEWRLSFSQAEQILVYAMNHTQFLVYGLLKIFLKEIVNHGVEEPLLCSYFLKTTVFWMIQVGSVVWHPNNFLNCFWECLKYLIHCVDHGEFPNFFIPRNNMFINKVVGAARVSLLEQLYRYYNTGVACLLLSPTLRSILEPALSGRTLLIPSTAIFRLDFTAKQEVSAFILDGEDALCYFNLLPVVERLSCSSLSPYQALSLQYHTAIVFVGVAFAIVNCSSYNTCRNAYSLHRIACNMLKLASRIGPVSYSLYLALYYFRTGRYNAAVRVTFLTKQRLSQPFIMYNGVDRQRYSEAVSGLSMSRKMKNCWVMDLQLRYGINYIDELILEQEVMKQNGDFTLVLPPLVLTEMLLVLSNFRLGDMSQSLQSLADLESLLLYDDDDRYIPSNYRNVSWQLLGICQHVVGDLHGALHSYQQSLRQEQFDNIQTATENRIMLVKRQLQRKI
jgi:hypothetical protein